MITKRDLSVAILTATLTTGGMLGAGALAREHESRAAILGPATFDWNNMKAVATPTGEVRSLYRGPTATLAELEMHVTTLNPGTTSHPPHHHVNEELVIIREGTVETLSNGQWVRLGPGSLIFNASDSLHGLRNVGPTAAVYHVINWSAHKE
jgi:XRE family transcriptional regulator, regulator of sulfur utilization